MDDEEPLRLNNSQWVLTPLNSMSGTESTNSGTSGISNHSLFGNSCVKSTASEHQKSNLGNECEKDVPSALVSIEKKKSVPAVKKKKKKKKVKKGKYYCQVCEVDLSSAGQYRSHHLGKQHQKKTVPKMKPEFSVTVMNISSNIAEGVLYDYFSIVGMVDTVFIFIGEESYAIIEFVYRCSVDHAIECLSAHILDGTKLTLIKGLPFEGKFLKCLTSVSQGSEKLPSPKKCIPETEMKEEICNACKILLNAGNIRDHYLSIEHTKNAYSRIKAKHCINVIGLHHDTSVVKALYDHFSHPGKVITIVIFQEKKVCAVVEFSQKCSVSHAVKCLVPHKLGNTKLTVSAGLPFGGNLPKMPKYLCRNKDLLDKSLPADKSVIDEQGKITREKEKKKAVIAATQEKTVVKKKRGRTLSGCDICKVNFRAGRHRRHFISETHLSKAIPCMRESSCVTISGFPTETTVGALYDFCNCFESVRTIDTRKQKEGLVIVEFESDYPLKNIVDCVTTKIVGDAMLTIIRGRPAPGIPVQSPVSYHKEVLQNDCGVNAQPASCTSSCIPDRTIQSEFENAMKSLRMQESSKEQPAANNRVVIENHVSPKEQQADNNRVVIENHGAKNIKTSNPNSETDRKVETKPVMCDACSFFYNPEQFRYHHISKKHNENAMRYMNAKCCISVKGFFKDTRLQSLFDCLMPFGNVKAIVIHRKKELVAIVEFYDAKSAHDARKTKNPVMLKNNTLVIQNGYPRYNAGWPVECLPPHSTVMSSLQKLETVHQQMSCLQSSILLSDKNTQARIDLCNLVREVLAYFFPHCKLHLFGSSVNSFGLQGSDVDVLFEVHSDKPNEAEQEKNLSKPEIKSPGFVEAVGENFPLASLASLSRVSQLDFIKKVLRKYPQKFHTVVLVSSAACPIVKFVSIRYGLNCDLSNGNRLSLCNTGLLRLYGRLDERVIPLVTTLRYWAKCFNYINSCNFSSYAFTLLVIFFLQTREPQILPSVKFLRSQTDKEMHIDGIDCSFCSDIAKIEPSTNSQTLESLLWEFFEYYGNFDFSKFVLSPLTGQCESVELFNLNENSDAPKFKVSPVNIQDPFVTARNVSSFVKENALAQMTDHLRRITKGRCDYIEMQKSQPNPCDCKWGIPQLFDIMPEHKKSKESKKKRKVSSSSMIKITLNKKTVDSVKKKYDISCTQCVPITEIAVHEICCSIVDLLCDVLLFDVEVIADMVNYCEWKTKVQSQHYACSCGNPCNSSPTNLNVKDDIQNEKQKKNLLEMKNSFHLVSLNDSCVNDYAQNQALTENCLEPNADLKDSSISGLQYEEPKENDLETKDCSSSSDSNSEGSGDEDVYLSGEEDTLKTVNVDVRDELEDAQNTCPEVKSLKRFDVKEQKPLLCITLTATHQTWVCRNKYGKQCNRNDFESILEFEKCVSRKISKDQTLKMEHPAEFQCEFYVGYKGSHPSLFLKVTPPEVKRCWKPCTLFLKSYLPKMVGSAL